MPTQDVLVRNTAANPVVSRMQDNPARQPFQQELHFGLNTWPTWPTVPAGKCLVIECVSGYVNVPTGGTVTDLALQTQAGTQGAAHRLPVTLMASTGVIDRYVTCHMLRVYASPGTQVTFSVGGSGTLPGDLSWDLTISGHLVDVL